MKNNTAKSARSKLYEIIFEADTPTGKLFDILLIFAILISVTAVMLDSVKEINENYGGTLYLIEWIFTILFTLEYLLRLACARQPHRYAGSFFGIVDLLAIAPTYLSVLFPGSQYFLVIRILRVLRIFRILKFIKYVREASALTQALRSSRRKITIFLFTVLILVVILGSVMYIIEGPERGFSSIPRSIYWAIVTLTTVGYGDISPKTPAGQALAALVMILGYAIIAVPTGIVTVELSRSVEKKVSTKICPQCSKEGHESDAKHCKFCGALL